jgi:hypothetical protein
MLSSPRTGTLSLMLVSVFLTLTSWRVLTLTGNTLPSLILKESLLAMPTKSKNCLEFVKVVKAKIPAGKTVSIAAPAPAPYWYLKQFLIEDMSKVVDYIIYM